MAFSLGLEPSNLLSQILRRLVPVVDDPGIELIERELRLALADPLEAEGFGAALAGQGFPRGDDDILFGVQAANDALEVLDGHGGQIGQIDVGPLPT